MGLIRTAKKSAISDYARQAREEGRTVFVARFWDDVGDGVSKTGTEVLEAAEAEGWRLDHFAYAWVEIKSRSVGIYIFRPAG